MIRNLVRTLLALTLACGIAAAGVKLSDAVYDISGSLNGTLTVRGGGLSATSNTTEGGIDEWLWDANSGKYVIIDGRTGNEVGTVEILAPGGGSLAREVTISGYYVRGAGSSSPLPEAPNLTGTRR